jgi:hypothetical protein
LCALIGSINVCNRTDNQAYFGKATAYVGHVAIRGNGKTQ